MIAEPAAGPTFRYRVFGLSVHANHPVAGLALDGGRGGPDLSLRVRFSAAEVRTEEHGEICFENTTRHASGRPLLRIVRTREGRTHTLEHGSGVVCHVDRDGRLLTIDWPAHLREDPWEFVLGFASAYLLQLRGTVCLHAAAVARDDRALLLAGPPESGKSTLAAGLLVNGWTLLADDVAALSCEDGVMCVHAGPATLRPRASAVEALRRLPATGGVGWSPSAEAFCVDIDPIASGAYCGGRRVVGGLCLVNPDEAAPGVSVEPMEAADAVVALIGDAWPSSLDDRHARGRALDMVSRVVAQAGAVRLTYNPRTPEWLPAAVAAIAGADVQAFGGTCRS